MEKSVTGWFPLITKRFIYHTHLQRAVQSFFFNATNAGEKGKKRVGG